MEYLDTIRNILIKQGPNGVIELLRNLRNVDQSKSNGIDIDEFVSVIDNLFKDNENKFSMDEIQTIFNVYDIQESGVMEYQKFISDLFVLHHLLLY